VISDLHIHYAMHLQPELRDAAREKALQAAGRRYRLRAWLIDLVGRFLNREHPWSSWRVDMEKMRTAGFEVALSPLYSPFAELSPDSLGDPPEPAALEDVLYQLGLVEDDIREHHAGAAQVVRSQDEFDTARAAGRIALVHCVEGGFQLGATTAAIGDGVRELARRGVVYVTLAHLVYRGVATSANAFPFMSDAAYRKIFDQPGTGLSALGQAAVRAMYQHHVLVDLSHMNAAAIDATLRLMDELDPHRTVPVIASHVAVRLRKGLEYNLDTSTIGRIVERGGLIGLILAERQLGDGATRPRRFEETAALLFEHIDAIAAVADNHRNVALGSDLDGFIRPVVAGLQTAAELDKLEPALREKYGSDAAEAITVGNVRRLLEATWARRAATRAEGGR